MARLARYNPTTGEKEIFAPSGEFEDRFSASGEATVRFENASDAGAIDILAYSGTPVDRWWGKLAIELTGIEHESQTTLLLEHDDMKPVGVLPIHAVEVDGLHLRGYLLNDDASEDAARLRKQTRPQGPGRPGLKLKSSIGVRFKDYRFLEKGEKVVCNGRTLEYSEEHDTLLVTKCHLFENSLIYVNPADLGTTAHIMRYGASTMSVPKDSATAAVLAASLAGGTTPAPALAPIVRFSDLSDEARKAALSEARAEIEKQTKDFADAFPDPSQADWREKMRKEGKTVEQAKLIAYETLEAARRKDAEETKLRGEIADRLGAQYGRDGRAFDTKGAERRDGKIESGAQFSPTRVAEELLHRQGGAAVYLFGHEALNVMTRAINFDGRYVKLEGGGEGPAMSDAFIREAATLLLASTPSDRRHRLEQLSTGGSGGHAALDLSMITVKGFIDAYHNAMETEDDWGVKICYELESNQETEIVRWLGYFPQLAPFNEKPEEAFVPTYSIQFTNVWYDHTIGLDVQDFMLQKFGKINQLMGQSGGVAKRHWNKLAAAQLEANNKSYDAVALFSTAHVMGGKAPTNQSNDLSAANGQVYCAVPDPGNITPAQMNAVLLNAAPQLMSYFAANGEPLNEERSRRLTVITPVKWAGVTEAAVYSNRLDGSPTGAGGGRDNPLKVDSERTGDKWEVVSSPRLASQTGHTTDNYIYVALLGNDRKPLLRAEPIGLSMFFAGPGSEVHRKQNKFAFWGRSLRSVAPGAWSSILRIKLGA